MTYKYAGSEPYRIGSSLVRPGDTREMAAPPSKLWVLVEPPRQKPVRQVKEEARPSKGEMSNG